MAVSVKPLTAAGFDLKGLKKWSTRDGGGYQFTLTYGGKPVATVTNDGHGGMLNIDWAHLTWRGEIYFPKDATPTQRKSIGAAGKVALAAMTKLKEIVAATPPVEFHGHTLSPGADWLMEELVNLADLRKVCKRKTAFQLPDDGDAKYNVINMPYSPEARAYVLGRWPKAKILNDEI